MDKNFPGITTGLQMQTYLVITGFERRKNKKGAEYGMSVSFLQPPEAVWGYEAVTSSYKEEPAVSRRRVIERVLEKFPGCDEGRVVKVIGK